MDETPLGVCNIKFYLEVFVMKLSRWKISGDCYLNERENYLPDHWISAMADIHCGSGTCSIYRPSERGYKKENLLKKMKNLSYVDEVLETTEIEIYDATIIGIDYITEGQWQTFITILVKEHTK